MRLYSACFASSLPTSPASPRTRSTPGLLSFSFSAEGNGEPIMSENSSSSLSPVTSLPSRSRKSAKSTSCWEGDFVEVWNPSSISWAMNWSLSMAFLSSFSPGTASAPFFRTFIRRWRSSISPATPG